MTKSNIAANLRRYMKLSNSTKTIEQLSDKAGIGKSTLSNILNARSDTSISILDKIAKALNITTEKLLAPKPELKSLRFRTMKTMSAREKAAMENLLYEAAQWIQDYSKFSEDHPSTQKFDLLNIQNTDPIVVAKLVRQIWKIADNEVILNFEDYIFNSGIKILGIPFGYKKTFGLSIGIPDGGPAIVINTDPSISGERKIYTLAHELGHLLLHKDRYGVRIEEDSDIDKEEEKQADIFASHLLMPQEGFETFYKQTQSLGLVDCVLKIKRHFKVSYMTVLMRIHETYGFDKQNLIIQFRALYTRRTGHDFSDNYEPLSLGDIEFINSSAKDSIFSAVKEGFSLQQAAFLLGISAESIEEEYSWWTTIRNSFSESFFN